MLALTVFIGKKTEKEKFAGAKATYAIEGLMPDGKALQCGTSHNLGQGFAKAFKISFIGRDEKKHLPWQNSWGLSTRLIGAVVMTHSDDKGLVLPPKAAENKLVIIPIIFEDSKDEVLKKVKELKKELAEYSPILDDREEYKPGWKFNEWELKGIPLRLELGPKDLEKAQVILVRRDTNEKITVSFKDIKKTIDKSLDKIQTDLFIKAKKQIDEKKKVQWNVNVNGVQLDALVSKKGYLFVEVAGKETDRIAWRAVAALDRLFVIAWKIQGAEFSSQKGGIYNCSRGERTCKWPFTDAEFETVARKTQNVRVRDAN